MHVVVYSYFFVTPVSVFSSFYDYLSDTHRMKKKFKLVKKQTQTTAHKTIGYFQIPHYTLYFLPRTSKFITEDLKIENSCYLLKKKLLKRKMIFIFNETAQKCINCHKAMKTAFI